MAIFKDTFTVGMEVNVVKCDECGAEFYLCLREDLTEQDHEKNIEWWEAAGWYRNEKEHSELYCPMCGKFVHNKPASAGGIINQ